MSPEVAAPEVDWARIARLPSITAEATDLDIVELVQRGLIPARLRLTHGVLAALDGVASLVVRDIEATPLLIGSVHAGTLEVRPLRPVVVGEPSELEPADLAVVVRGMPTANDLVRVDALTAPHTEVVWLVLASRSRSGRQLLASIPGIAESRESGRHRVVRTPWPVPGVRGAFERPQLPTASQLAAAFQARHYVVVGDLPGSGEARTDRGGTVIFLTGLSGSGKSTIAKALHDTLEQRTDREITLLDGDDVRRMLSAELGFDAAGRAANVQRVSWVGALLARAGGIAITSLIAPFAAGRADARQMAEPAADFLLVWVATPIAECERRDRKGLYAQARAGLITNFTGIDSPYEEPADADLVIDTTKVGVSEAVELVVSELEARALRRGDQFGPPAMGYSDLDQPEEAFANYDI